MERISLQFGEKSTVLGANAKVNDTLAVPFAIVVLTDSGEPAVCVAVNVLVTPTGESALSASVLTASISCFNSASGST